MKRILGLTFFISSFAIISASFTLSPPLLPNPTLTPGDTLPVTAFDVCKPGYSSRARNVPESIKLQIYKEYGINANPKSLPKNQRYEIDHLISLELGGSNSPKNLWPEAYFTKPYNAYIKDSYENWLHLQVCAGKMPLEEAQKRISTNWIENYKKDMLTTK